MSSAIIEICRNDGKIQYALTKSNDAEIDKLADIAINSVGMFVKSGGNVQNLVGSMGGGLKQQLMGALTQGLGGGMFNQGM